MAVQCSCDITALLSIEYTGIISASMSGTNELVRVIGTCDDPNAEKTLRGPSSGTINITCYPFEKGADRFLGVTCASSAGMSRNYITKYDCNANRTYFILQKGGTAYREGSPIEGITIVDESCSYRALNADASGGPYSVYTDRTRTDGYGLISTLRPIPFDSTLDEVYTILGITTAKLQSYSIDIGLPQGARATYNFLYALPGCPGGDEV